MDDENNPEQTGSQSPKVVDIKTKTEVDTSENDPAPDPYVLDALARCLDRAMRGEIQELVLVTNSVEGNVTRVLAGGAGCDQIYTYTMLDQTTEHYKQCFVDPIFNSFEIGDLEIDE